MPGSNMERCIRYDPTTSYKMLARFKGLGRNSMLLLLKHKSEEGQRDDLKYYAFLLLKVVVSFSDSNLKFQLTKVTTILFAKS